MICPKCNSNNITSTPITVSTSKDKIKGFSLVKSCLGFLLFNIPGILCGLCGMGKSKTKTKTKIKVVKVCQSCGFRF